MRKCVGSRSPSTISGKLRLAGFSGRWPWQACVAGHDFIAAPPRGMTPGFCRTLIANTSLNGLGNIGAIARHYLACFAIREFHQAIVPDDTVTERFKVMRAKAPGFRCLTRHASAFALNVASSKDGIQKRSKFGLQGLARGSGGGLEASTLDNGAVLDNAVADGSSRMDSRELPAHQRPGTSSRPGLSDNAIQSRRSAPAVLAA